jgi:hypothetical protein
MSIRGDCNASFAAVAVDVEPVAGRRQRVSRQP